MGNIARTLLVIPKIKAQESNEWKPKPTHNLQHPELDIGIAIERF